MIHFMMIYDGSSLGHLCRLSSHKCLPGGDWWPGQANSQLFCSQGCQHHTSEKSYHIHQYLHWPSVRTQDYILQNTMDELMLEPSLFCIRWSKTFTDMKKKHSKSLGLLSRITPIKKRSIANSRINSSHRSARSTENPQIRLKKLQL